MKKLLPLVTILLLASCELMVDVDVPFEAKQVTVNSFFNPDSLWSAHLSLNRNILDEYGFDEINDALVIVYEAGNPIDTLTNVGGGHFRSDEKPEAGKPYSISVSTPGYSDLTSSSFTPHPAPIVAADLYESNNGTMLKVKIADAASEKNYYELYLEVEDEYYDYDRGQLMSRRSTIWLSSKDPALPDNGDRPSGSFLFDDVRFNGAEKELLFETSGGGLSNPGVMATVTLKTLSEDGYNYLRTARLQDDTSGDPLAQPVNVYNNIQNGFGIFAGYSASVYTRSKPRPLIISIEPMTGKPGDHIIITGENFLVPPEGYTSVGFRAPYGSISGQIVDLTPTRIEVIVPENALTGRILIFSGGLAVSDSEFVVIN